MWTKPGSYRGIRMDKNSTLARYRGWSRSTERRLREIFGPLFPRRPMRRGSSPDAFLDWWLFAVYSPILLVVFGITDFFLSMIDPDVGVWGGLMMMFMMGQWLFHRITR